MTGQAERICDLAHQCADTEDAEQALRCLVELRREVDDIVDVQVERALAGGRSFSDVARALGISRQAAHRRFRKLAPKRRPRRQRGLVASDAAQRAVRLAQAEALAAATSPGSEHVLLGVLRIDNETTRALVQKGVTPERIRAHARTSNGDGRASSSIRRIVTRAARVAITGGDRVLDVQPLLLAAVADPDGGARSALSALGIEPASLGASLEPRPHGELRGH
jgi:AcrR family transcriptional regulator